MIHHGDALAVLKTIDDGSVDAIVTDPPYGLRFMSRKWDYEVPSADVWRECLRVTKPGGFLLSFSSARTYHRMASAVEDGGWEIRDQLMWLYGSGVPKSPTQLKCSHEPIVMARKPFAGSEIANVAEHGTGALNIGPCRIGDRSDKPQRQGVKRGAKNCYKRVEIEGTAIYTQGRWPANVLHDGCLEGKSYAPYFYAAKASPSERQGNPHPTIKPIALMHYLVRLVTPEGGTVLDPYAGSGTTLVACQLEGFDGIGIEREEEYVAIGWGRLRAPDNNT